MKTWLENEIPDSHEKWVVHYSSGDWRLKRKEEAKWIPNVWWDPQRLFTRFQSLSSFAVFLSIRQSLIHCHVWESDAYASDGSSPATVDFASCGLEATAPHLLITKSEYGFQVNKASSLTHAAMLIKNGPQCS